MASSRPRERSPSAGSFMLVRSPDPFLRVSLRLILATTVFTTLFFAFIVGAGLRAQRRRVATGIEGLLGEPVLAKTDLEPVGHVLAEGELWSAENVGKSQSNGRPGGRGRCGWLRPESQKGDVIWAV